MDSWCKSRDCFRKAARLFEAQVEVIQIPYESTTLPGYYFKNVTAHDSPRPTLIAMTGFDGTAEELYF